VIVYRLTVSKPRLVPTSELARELGLSDRTIQRYRQLGVLRPDVVSPGGHARWNIERVREQLRQMAAEDMRDADEE
jgi:DNA-binding transcriptional MerR regulator